MKKNGQARLIYVRALTATSPAREGEPVGTADTSRLDYIRWQYDADTEKERPTRPSRIMLNMTRRARHWRLYDSEIKKGGKTLLYDDQYDSERQALPPCMVFNMTERGEHCHLK